MTEALERTTLKRVMWRLVPFMGACFMINWLDRTNVGFAALAMNKDLGFTATTFGTGAGIFLRMSCSTAGASLQPHPPPWAMAVSRV